MRSLTRDEIAKTLSAKLIEICRTFGGFGEMITEEDFVVDCMNISHGKGALNPLDHVKFFKKNGTVARHLCKHLLIVYKLCVIITQVIKKAFNNACLFIWYFIK